MTEAGGGGGGRHARLLCAAGFSLVAVDRDASALSELAGASCEVRRIDLETGAPWPLGGGYDGIVVTNYLHRPLLPALAAALAPGEPEAGEGATRPSIPCWRRCR